MGLYVLLHGPVCCMCHVCACMHGTATAVLESSMYERTRLVCDAWLHDGLQCCCMGLYAVCVMCVRACMGPPQLYYLHVVGTSMYERTRVGRAPSVLRTYHAHTLAAMPPPDSGRAGGPGLGLEGRTAVRYAAGCTRRAAAAAAARIAAAAAAAPRPAGRPPSSDAVCRLVL
jgi:hypothetical protein